MSTLKVKLVLHRWIKIVTPGYNQLAQRTCDSENPCGYKIVLGAGRGNMLGLDDKSLVLLNARSVSYVYMIAWVRMLLVLLNLELERVLILQI